MALVLLTVPWFGVTAAATLVRSDTLVPHAVGRAVGQVTATDGTFDEQIDELAEQLDRLAPAEVEAAGGPAQIRATLRAAVREGALTRVATEIGEALGRSMLDGSDLNEHLAATGADAGASAIDDLAAAVGPPLDSSLRANRDALSAPIDVGRPAPAVDGGRPARADGITARVDGEQPAWRGLGAASVPLTAAALVLAVALTLAARAARPPRWLVIGAVVAWLLAAGLADLAAGRGSLGGMILAPVLWACWPAAVLVAVGGWRFSRPAAAGPAAAG